MSGTSIIAQISMSLNAMLVYMLFGIAQLCFVVIKFINSKDPFESLLLPVNLKRKSVVIGIM